MVTSAETRTLFGHFVEEFRAESDRAAVILGAAQLDLLLYQLIQKVLLPTASSRDELLDSDGPLGAFSSRINMAHRLGLIDTPFARALHLVRKIRNTFAHEPTSSSLSVGAHRDRVRELTAPFIAKPGFDRFHSVFFGEERNPSNDFRCTLGIMAVRLEAAFDDCRTLTDAHAWTLVPPNYDGPAEASTEDATPPPTIASNEDTQSPKSKKIKTQTANRRTARKRPRPKD